MQKKVKITQEEHVFAETLFPLAAPKNKLLLSLGKIMNVTWSSTLTACITFKKGYVHQIWIKSICYDFKIL